MKAEKRCATCKQKKDIDEFYDHPETAARKSHSCKECCKESSKKNYEKTKKNLTAEQIDAKKQSAAKFRSNPENKIKKRLKRIGLAGPQIDVFLISCPKIEDYLINWSIDSQGIVIFMKNNKEN